MSRFLSAEELSATGFASLGTAVCIDRSVILLSPERISIASHVRIDAFSLISPGAGSVRIGSNVHIAAGVYLYGSGGITIDDFVGLSSRSTVLSQTDDFSGNAMTGPTIPERFRAVASAPVHIGRHGLVGVGAVLMPGVTIGEGAAIGALSLVKGHIAPFTIAAGVPARTIAERSRNLLTLEIAYLGT